MELGTLLGFILGIGFIIFSMIWTGTGSPIESMTPFADLPSFLVVVGGSLASALISVKIRSFMTAFRSIGIAFKPPVLDPAGAIDTVVQLANTARKEGVLALEESAANMGDQFLKKGIMLIVDGTDPELVKGIMETELSYIDERHSSNATFYEQFATYAPAWGMVGTMIGLILMLGNLDDPDALGASMAISLITTFYGVIVANFLCNPVASKLRNISQEEILFKTVLVEGMLSIQAGENPRIIEEKLKSYLAPALRGDVGGSGGRSGGDE